jgi:hypothetical protein
VAEAQLDADFARDFQRLFIVPRREALVALLQRAVQRSELAAATNLNVLADMIYDAKWYRFLLHPAPLDEAFAQAIVEWLAALVGEAFIEGDQFDELRAIATMIRMIALGQGTKALLNLREPRIRRQL